MVMKNVKKVLAIAIGVSLILGSVNFANKATAAKVEVPVQDSTVEVGGVSKLTVTFDGDTKSSKGFTWYTSKASIKSEVQVVEKTTDSPNFNGAVTFSGDSFIPDNKTDAVPPTNEITTKQEFGHKVKATGLKADTTYYYRVGDSSVNLWSNVYEFKTAPKDGAFTFIDLADPQAKDFGEASLAADSIKKAIKTVDGSKFLAINGDIVDDGKKEFEWDWLFNGIGDDLKNTTIVPVAGNHESGKNTFIDHFNLPVSGDQNTESGAYYSYDYSNAHFVVLNNNENSAEYADFSKSQLEWMKADIAKARDNGSKWIITLMHKGPYTTSNHATDKDIMGDNGVRTKLAPQMESLGIDLVLQGHDHIYSRTKAIKPDGTAEDGSTIKESFNGQSIEYKVNPNGTIYLNPATAGPKTYYKNKKIDPNYYNLFDRAEESHSAKYGPDPSDSTRPVRSVVQNFESISIDNNKLSVISYEIDRNINNGEPFIIDSFGIEKSETAKITAVKNNQVIEQDKTNKAGFNLSMKNLTNANAFEASFKYDSSKYSVDNIDYLLPNLSEISREDKDGVLKIVFGKTDKSIINSKEYLDLARITLAPKNDNINQTISLGLASVKTTELDRTSEDYKNTKEIAASLEKTSGDTNVYYASDINNDSSIDLGDISIALAFYKDSVKTSNWNYAVKADVNGDGLVDIIDLQLILGNER